MEQTINAFKANPGSDYELYYGEDFKVFISYRCILVNMLTIKLPYQKL